MIFHATRSAMKINALGSLICFVAFIANEVEACKGRRRYYDKLPKTSDSTETTGNEDSEEGPEIQLGPNKVNQKSRVKGKQVEELTVPSLHSSKTFLLFYGDHTIYSNFCKSKFTLDGQKFNCVEQYFQYAKAVLFEDGETAKKILKSTWPLEQRRLGRKVTGYNDIEWESAGLEAMRRGVRAKFQQNADMKEKLLATAGLTLAEASPIDRKWGIGIPGGLDINNPKAADQQKWKGKNLLGQVLMQVRDELLKGDGSLTES